MIGINARERALSEIGQREVKGSRGAIYTLCAKLCARARVSPGATINPGKADNYPPPFNSLIRGALTRERKEIERERVYSGSIDTLCRQGERERQRATYYSQPKARARTGKPLITVALVVVVLLFAGPNISRARDER